MHKSLVARTPACTHFLPHACFISNYGRNNRLINYYKITMILLIHTVKWQNDYIAGLATAQKNKLPSYLYAWATCGILVPTFACTVTLCIRFLIIIICTSINANWKYLALTFVLMTHLSQNVRFVFVVNYKLRIVCRNTRGND